MIEPRTLRYFVTGNPAQQSRTACQGMRQRHCRPEPISAAKSLPIQSFRESGELPLPLPPKANWGAADHHKHHCAHLDRVFRLGERQEIVYQGLAFSESLQDGKLAVLLPALWGKRPWKALSIVPTS